MLSYNDTTFLIHQVEIAQPLSEICMEFPDVVIGKNSLIVDHLVE